MLEKEVEQYLVTQVSKHGGLCLKFVSPGRAGVPDRIVLHKGNVYFVELKSPTGTVRKSQKIMFRRFEYHGIYVHVVHSKEEVNDFIRSIDDRLSAT